MLILPGTLLIMGILPLNGPPCSKLSKGVCLSISQSGNILNTKVSEILEPEFVFFIVRDSSRFVQISNAFLNVALHFLLLTATGVPHCLYNIKFPLEFGINFLEFPIYVKGHILPSSPKNCRIELSRLLLTSGLWCLSSALVQNSRCVQTFFDCYFLPSDGEKDKTPKAKKEVKEKETKEVKEVTKEPKEIKDKAPPPPPKIKSPKVSPPPKSPKKSPVTKSPTPPPRARPTRRSVSKSVSKSPSPVKRAPRARSSSSSGSSRSPRRRKRSPTPKPTKLYVAHLTRNVTKDHVFEIFSVYGHVKSVDLPMDRFNFLPRGFAYVEYDEAEDAESALKHMDGGQIDGQEITTQMVHPMRPRDIRPARRPSPPPPRRRPPPPAWRRSPPARFRGPFRAGRRSRSPSPRRRSRSKSRSRSRSPPRRRRYSRSSSSSSR